LTWRFGAVLAAVFVMLVACTSSPAAKRQPAAVAPTALRIGIRQPSTLDPVLRANPSDLLIARQIYEPLVGFDPETGALIPRLASSWDVVDGGKGFRFHLRPEARFQDGGAVSADDVAFELNRLARKGTNSGLAHLLELVVGYDQVHGSGVATDLSGVKVEDPHTLLISLTQVWFEFPYVLTDPSTAPIPSAAFQSDPTGFMRHPIGSGPYALAAQSVLPGDLVLERSKTYWGPQPTLGTVRFVGGSTASSGALADLAAGRIDIGDIRPDDMPQALNSFGSRGFTPLAAEISLGFNLADPALRDPRLRRAVSLALDRPTLAKMVYGDILVPADGLVPRGLPGHTDLACADCTHDPAQARALVQQVSGTAHPEIACDYPQSAKNDAVMQELTSDLEAAGIRLVARPHAPTAFVATLNDPSRQMFLLVWVADYPLADWFLAPPFSANSPDNRSGFQDPAVQSLIDASRSTADGATRLGLQRQVEQKVLADLPTTPLGFFRNHYAATSRVQGFYVDVLGAFDVARLSLSAS
jgi:peptide/nickel transport system substrate-binding protein/oligopeptide transport system substrate-binding protein